MELTQKKLDEWRNFGKDAYKSAHNMARTNNHHTDYDTHEKREAEHDKNYTDNYMLTQTHDEKLIARMGYTQEQLNTCHAEWQAGYKASRAWYAKHDAIQQKVLDRYAVIFDQARLVGDGATTRLVSTLGDRGACGWANISVQECPENEELCKALKHFNGDTTLRLGNKGMVQSIDVNGAVANEVASFLRGQGVMATVRTIID